jgi:aspartyl-tRNA(Asn)/glutamyl-tRNA(Gln) amidotransferase subunit C
MAVTRDDVRHIAALARLSVSDERAEALVAELNTILAHIDVLSGVDTANVDAAAIGERAAPLRDDTGPQLPLARPRETFAPRMADGFFLVPRLSTHEDPETS